MRMLAWLCCTLCWCGGHARAGDAGELFLDAYLLREEGLKAEKSGDFKTAYDQYRASARIYDQVARDFPDWKPEMVAFRRTGMAEQINAVAERAAKMSIGRTGDDTRPIGPATPGAGAAQPRAAAVATVPATTARTNPAAPSVTARPPVATPKSADDPYARMRIQELERQQAGAKQTMDLLAKERDALKARLVDVENSSNLSQYEARKFREDRDAARKQIQDLQEKGINRSVAEKARISELEATIARNTKDLAEAEKRIAEANAKAAEAGEKSAAASANAATANAKAAEATARATEATAKNNESNAKLAEAISQGRKLGDAELAATRKEREAMATRLAVVEAELAASRRDTRLGEESLRIMTAERDRWKSERDQLAEKLTNASGTSTLMKDNQKLEKQLADARVQLAELQSARKADADKLEVLKAAKADDASALKAMQAARDADAEKIRQLRNQVQQVEGELAAARKENASFRDQMVALERRLGEAQTALDAAAATAAAANDHSMAEENRTLKEMVIRQLRQQAYRARARDLLLRELAKLEINSKSMLQYIDQLEGKSSLPTPEEVTRVDDHEIRALAGVELSGKYFNGDEEPQAPAISTPSTDPAAATTSTPGGPAAAANPPAQPAPPAAAIADATGGFDFQKRSLASTAEMSFQKGDFKQAEETYRLIVEADPADLRMQCNLGVALIKQERFGEAVGRFQDALSRDESNAFAHLMLGVCHWKLRQPELAVDRLNRCLVLQKSNPQAWLYLGLVAVDASQWKDAEIAFKKAIESKPDYPMAHYNLAVVYTKPGFADPVQAKRAYDESLRLGGTRDEAIELFLRMGPQIEPPPGIDLPPGDFPPGLEGDLPHL